MGNAYLVPRCRDAWLFLVQGNGRLQIPGGKKEPGETHERTLRREVLEELGARIVSCEPIGYWHVHSKSPQPRRPHLPHPESNAVAYVGEVVLVGAPTNPAGATPTERVEGACLADVLSAFRRDGRDDLADLYQLAADHLAMRRF